VIGFDRQGDYLTIRFAPSEKLAGPLGRLLAAASELGVDILSIGWDWAWLRC